MTIHNEPLGWSPEANALRLDRMFREHFPALYGLQPITQPEPVQPVDAEALELLMRAAMRE